MAEKLGEGTYGSVIKARNRETQEMVAIKIMKFTAEEAAEGIHPTALREISLLKKLNHPNIVLLKDVFIKQGEATLVFEYVETDVKLYMKRNNNSLPPTTINQLTYQLCRGLEFLHGSGIIHRDVKPQNLLLNVSRPPLCMKIADFGLARAYKLRAKDLSEEQLYTHDVITIWYRPPEILLGSTNYDIAVDLWGVGCVLAEMAVGGPLFSGKTEIDTLVKIFETLGTPTEQIWPGVTALPHFNVRLPQRPIRGWDGFPKIGPDGIELLNKLLCYDPSNRVSAKQALTYRYFRDTDRS